MTGLCGTARVQCKIVWNRKPDFAAVDAEPHFSTGTSSLCVRLQNVRMESTIQLNISRFLKCATRRRLYDYKIARSHAQPRTCCSNRCFRDTALYKKRSIRKLRGDQPARVQSL